MEPRARMLAEEAIRALGRLDVPSARTAIAQAFSEDHRIVPLVDVVNLACAEIEEDGRVTTSTWNTLADAVIDSPDLQAVVESSRP